PPAMIAAVGFHHQPWEAGDHQEVAGLVFLADLLAKMLGHPSFDPEKGMDVFESLDGPIAAFLAQRRWSVEKIMSRGLKEKLDGLLESMESAGP
ncbi:MAG: hypothetical protein JRJ59_08650, partial [Deltaproteobacteria bacterium]|nr:hypothetical protein [Deltaproteobacteria bacterium]